MTDTDKPDNTGASNDIDEILDYVQVQMKKPVPAGIREEVIGVGDLIVKEEAKAAILNLIAQEANKARLLELKSALYLADDRVDMLMVRYLEERITVLTAHKEQADE